MMGRRIGRGQLLAAFALPAILGWTGSAAAQDEEIILDPELTGSSPPPRASTTPTMPPFQEDGADESPPAEDFGWGPVYEEKPPAWGPTVEEASSPPPARQEEDEYDPLVNTGLARLELVGQVAADLRHEGDLEDAYESRLRFGGEVELRRSRRLRLMLGSRLDFFWAAPSHNDNVLAARNERVLDQDRFEVDVFATAAYVDATLSDGLHLRVGQQVVSLGRMDMYSPNDMLAAYDMRPQPRLDLAANKLAQPALRLDWDMSTWATLQAVYVPWFMPHLSRPNRDQYVAKVVSGQGPSELPTNIRELIDPSWQTHASGSSIRYIGPPPDFRSPQAQLRANFRGHGMEFALNAGTAIEKLPAVYYTPYVNDAVIDPSNEKAVSEVGFAVYEQQMVADVEFHRYNLIGFDGSFDISPVSIGFEFAYSPSRHLYAATRDGRHLPLPNVTEQITNPIAMDENQDGVTEWTPSNVTHRRIRKGVPMVQAALHVEWLKGETFALVGEMFWINALALPHDKSRDWWGFIPNTGAFVGGMVALSYALNDGQVRFDLTTVSMVGPSLILVPHVEVRAREGLYVDAGAQIFEGPAPGVNGMQNLNLGGLMSGYDQVFVGLRWLP